MKELITKKGSDDGWNSSSKCTMKYSSTTMTHHASTLWKPQSKKITLKSQVKPEDPNIMEYPNISSLEKKQQISGGSFQGLIEIGDQQADGPYTYNL